MFGIVIVFCFVFVRKLFLSYPNFIADGIEVFLEVFISSNKVTTFCKIILILFYLCSNNVPDKKQGGKHLIFVTGLYYFGFPYHICLYYGGFEQG